MRKAIWAEWIVARFTDRSRAAAIVGDLLETAAQRGTMSFWLSVAGIVVSHIWRRPIAFMAAYWLGLYWFGVFAIRNYGIHAVHRLSEQNTWEHVLNAVTMSCTLLWIAAPYAAIRFGLRDKFAQLVLGFCCLATIVGLYWWIPIVTVACIVLALAILIASVQFAQGRRALTVLVVTLFFGFGGGLLTFYLAAIWRNHYYPEGMAQGNSLVGTSLVLLAVWIATTACAWMHDRLLRRDQRGAEIESST